MKKESFIDACENNDVETVKRLIKEGVNPHQLEEAGLRKAVYKGAIDVVKYLLLIGCDKYECDSSSFMLAASQGHLEIVKLLYHGNKNVDEQQRGLEEAAQHGHIDIVNYLIEIGANIHYNNDLVLKYADSNLEMVQHLVGLGADVKNLLNHKNKKIKEWAIEYHQKQEFSLKLKKELHSSHTSNVRSKI